MDDDIRENGFGSTRDISWTHRRLSVAENSVTASETELSISQKKSSAEYPSSQVQITQLFYSI